MNKINIADIQVERRARTTELRLPCQVGKVDLWFSESPLELERAKQLCGTCLVRGQCLAGALHRKEPWGVWGAEIFDRGDIVARKQPRGRPRKVTPEETAERAAEASRAGETAA